MSSKLLFENSWNSLDIILVKIQLARSIFHDSWKVVPNIYEFKILEIDLPKITFEFFAKLEFLEKFVLKFIGSRNAHLSTEWKI